MDNTAFYVKPRTSQHCKAISTKYLAKQTNLSVQEQQLIHSGKINPQQLDHLIPHSVLGVPQDPNETHLIFKKHRAVHDTYLSQLIRDWVESIRQQSPNWEATADQVQDWKNGFIGDPTLLDFSYYFDGKPGLEYNKQAIHLLSKSLLQALEKGQYPSHLLDKLPTTRELTKKISTHMGYLSKKCVTIKAPRTLEELNETQAQERRTSRRYAVSVLMVNCVCHANRLKFSSTNSACRLLVQMRNGAAFFQFSQWEVSTCTLMMSLIVMKSSNSTSESRYCPTGPPS